MKKLYFNTHPDYTILRTKNGRPYFAHTDALFFNGSHTKNYCITVMAEKNIAVDIEECRPKHFQAIAEYVFTETEQKRLAQSAAIEKDFFFLWTIKEADIKLRGGNIFSIKDAVSINLLEAPVVAATAYPHSIFSFYLTKESEKQTAHFVVSIIIAGQDTNIEFEWHEPTETHTCITTERIFAYPAQRA
ncbi:4'-phosphopantetheinyl transferase superfamily protein [Treponema vincentii]